MAWLAALSLAAPARAEIGSGALALPAADRVFVPSSREAPLTLAATAGYGLTESQAGEGAHHRIAGTLAAAAALTPELALSLAFDGRYDMHPGGDSGAVGTPLLNLLGALPAARGVRLGAALSLAVPGRHAPSLDFAAASVALQGLASFRLPLGATLALQLGYRFDESAHAEPNPGALSNADRLALGLSSFDALPFGAALFEALRGYELFLELSGDALVGAGAPSLWRSPLRAALGARRPVLPGLSAELLLQFGLSARPAYAAITPLIAVEPRFAIALGLRYAPPLGAASEPVAPQCRVDGEVLDADGTPVAGVAIALRIAEHLRQTRSAEDGSYALQVPYGVARIDLDGPGLVPTTQYARVETANVQLTLRVARREARAQLRGLVRSFAGTALPASVRVGAIGKSVSADKDGRFVLELLPGEYEVEIECPGYLTQRRKVTVQANGVTLLNVELHEAGR